ARVSAALLLIMGLFTLSYAGLRASHLRASVQARLGALSPTDASRPSLEHYAKYGLLECKSYARPVEYQEFAKIPQPGDTVRWMDGNEDQAFIVGFDLPPEMFPQTPDENGVLDNGGLDVLGHIQYEF